MKLGLFIPTNNRTPDTVAPSIWIRALQFIPVWKNHGVNLSINRFFKRYDCAIVYRSLELSTIFKILWLKLTSQKVFYDQVINYFKPGNHISFKRKIFISIINSLVDGIICTTDPIAQSAKKIHKVVIRIPEGVDLNHFNKVKNNINFESPIFIWSGAHHKATFLNSYANDISGHINLITKKDIENESLDFDYHLIEWSHRLFPKDIITGDIALLPRDLSSAYNQGHSEFKALVFAVSGIPIIASKLPSYVQLSHFYDGIVFLEDYDNEIKSCISELKQRTFDVNKVRAEYDVNNLCLRLLKHLQYSLANLI